METALWIAVSVLSVVCLALVAALVLILRMWPNDTSHLASWVGAFNDGYGKGFTHGGNVGEAAEKTRMSAWNTANVPVEQSATPIDRPVERSVTVGEYPRAAGMPMPTPPRGGQPE